MDTDSKLTVSERHWSGKARLLRLLADIEATSSFRRSLYLTPATLEGLHAGQPVAESAMPSGLESIAARLGESETGLALFHGDDQAIAVFPPFPFTSDAAFESVDIRPMQALLSGSPRVAALLLRLGRYAVGVYEGEQLVASKTGGRYVKSRHRAGGSSQRRFERSRERLVRELFDEVCRVASEVLSRFDGRVDYLLFGGERHTLRAFAQRCPAMRSLSKTTLSRVLQVDRPGQRALESLPHEIWRSRVVKLTQAAAE